ncbi:MAG: hypothetical protein QUU85_04620 [Candidatus Eisenbacteria bacterium]|nr:hypothetical protein [Candidatus Eisenbacteria bacterium]
MKLVLAALVVAVFAPILANGFTWWDDDVTIHQNPRMNPPTLEGVAWYWGHAEQAIYIPLTQTVWGILAAVARRPGGADEAGIALAPWVFHAASLLAHLATALAVFALLRRFTARALTALAGATLFALHPVQVEAVAWASGLKDVLCGLFTILALWQYALFAGASDRDPAAPLSKRSFHYGMALLAFLAACFSKPTGMIVPVLAAILDLWLIRRPAARVARSLAPWLVVSAVFAIVARVVQPGTGLPPVPVWVRPLIAGDALSFYLFKLLWPVALAVDYGMRPELRIGWTPWIYLAWLLPLAIGYVAWRHRRRDLRPWAAALLFAGALLPVLGFVRFKFQLYSTTADHYLYPAMLGPALALAWLLDHRQAQRRWILAACAIVLAAFGARSFTQAAHWRDDIALWQQALRVNPRSFIAEAKLGDLEWKRERVDRAGEHWQAAARLNPDLYKIHEALTVYYARIGRMELAEEEARKTMQVLQRKTPDQIGGEAWLLVMLGDVWMGRGQPQRAQERYEEARRMDASLPGIDRKIEQAARAAAERPPDGSRP